jgi:hypothetical protein
MFQNQFTAHERTAEYSNGKRINDADDGGIYHGGINGGPYD